MDKKILSNTYELITSATEYVAQNNDKRKRDIEVVFAATQPAETVDGITLGYGQGVTNNQGVGSLWGRGNGALVVISVITV